MEKSIRTFIAIKITPDNSFIKLIRSIQNQLAREAIKWVLEDNMHLTLRFLGDTPKDQIPDIKSALEEAGKKFERFSLSVKGMGFFGSKNQPRVIFAKIEKSESLSGLAWEIENLLNSIGIEKEEKPFKPHLTIGRIKFIKRRNTFHSLIQKYESIEIQKSLITEIILYQSILNYSGPVYKPLKIIKLK